MIASLVAVILCPSPPVFDESSMSVPPEDEINNLVAAGFPITPAGLIPCGVAITCGVPVFIAACGDA